MEWIEEEATTPDRTIRLRRYSNLFEIKPCEAAATEGCSVKQLKEYFEDQLLEKGYCRGCRKSLNGSCPQNGESFGRKTIRKRRDSIKSNDLISCNDRNDSSCIFLERGNVEYLQNKFEQMEEPLKSGSNKENRKTSRRRRGSIKSNDLNSCNDKNGSRCIFLEKGNVEYPQNKFEQKEEPLNYASNKENMKYDKNRQSFDGFVNRKEKCSDKNMWDEPEGEQNVSITENHRPRRSLRLHKVNYEEPRIRERRKSIATSIETNRLLEDSFGASCDESFSRRIRKPVPNKRRSSKAGSDVDLSSYLENLHLTPDEPNCDESFKEAQNQISVRKPCSSKKDAWQKSTNADISSKPKMSLKRRSSVRLNKSLDQDLDLSYTSITYDNHDQTFISDCSGVDTDEAYNESHRANLNSSNTFLHHNMTEATELGKDLYYKNIDGVKILTRESFREFNKDSNNASRNSRRSRTRSQSEENVSQETSKIAMNTLGVEPLSPHAEVTSPMLRRPLRLSRSTSDELNETFIEYEPEISSCHSVRDEKDEEAAVYCTGDIETEYTTIPVGSKNKSGAEGRRKTSRRRKKPAPVKKTPAKGSETVKKVSTRLETIFEQPNGDTVMSVRKLKRFINFEESYSDIKVRRRKLKARKVNPSLKVNSDVEKDSNAMEVLLDKLSKLC